MAMYGTWNKKSKMWNTEQIIQNGKTLNSISRTGKTVKKWSMMNMRTQGIFNFAEMATYKNALVEAQYWVSNL